MEVRQMHFTKMIRDIIEIKLNEQELERLRNEIEKHKTSLKNENPEELNHEVVKIVKKIVHSEIITKGDSKKFRAEKKNERKGWFSKFLFLHFNSNLAIFIQESLMEGIPNILSWKQKNLNDVTLEDKTENIIEKNITLSQVQESPKCPSYEITVSEKKESTYETFVKTFTPPNIFEKIRKVYPPR